jgi:acetyl-CoA carboxylase biotin carboxyl carrier protein
VRPAGRPFRRDPITPMNQKELKELIEYIVEKDIAEFELERGDVKVRIKRAAPEAQTPEPRFAAVPHAPAGAGAAPPIASPVATSVPSPAPAAPAEEEPGLHIIRSPIVGTFYESPSPGAPPFAKAGDTISVGQVLCIIEAMKLMNEIESDYAGELVKTFVSNGQPVEYGQPLFTVRGA